MSVPRRLAFCIFAAFPAFILSACASDPNSGYALASPYRTDIQTVSVPIFRNDTFEPYIEEALTKAVITEIHRTTPWRVTSGDNAQAVLSGAITGVDMRKLSTQDGSGLTQELAVELTVSFEFKRRTDATILVARHNFRTADPFVPGGGGGTGGALGARGAGGWGGEAREIGRRGAIDDMARALVAELRSSW